MNTLSQGAMSFSDFLKWASVGRSFAYEQVKAGRLRIVKIGAKTVVLRADAEAWLLAHVKKAK
jgi:hypothetical protein